MSAHAFVIGLVFYGIINSPSVVHVTTERYSVRQIALQVPNLRRPEPARASKGALQTAIALKSAIESHSAEMHQIFRAAIGPQNLLQPDLPMRLADSEAIPLPQIQIWASPKPVVKMIVAPRPTPPTTVDVRPSTVPPTVEINLADVNFSASNLPTQKLALMPSTTTPIATKQTLSPVRLTPSMTSQRTAEPVPSAVLSMSDLLAKDGPVILPSINEVVRPSPQGPPNSSAGAELVGQDSQSRNFYKNGLDHGATNLNEVANSSSRSGASNIGTASASASNVSASGNLAGIQGSTTKISLAPDGHFGAVIVGQNLEDQFPELATLMSGRMAYTVYLHVGSARSWILRFSLPRSADAATAGNTNRLDAPWPYIIIRPNLTADQVNSDALMIHGFINVSGHFENLSMAFPKNCPQSPFILKSLEQWQFRPASQNGQVTRVEILLIIPEDYE